jgi:hypothetical protein
MTVSAQTMVDINKVWNVSSCINFGSCGTTNYYFGGDTTIGIHQYKLLIVDRDSGIMAPYEPIAMREDTAARQIFFYESTGETLVYDFSILQGNSYTTTINGCYLKITADSVDTVVLLNGESRKRIWVTIQSISGSCFPFSIYYEIWIEGIGSLQGLTRAGYYTFVADDMNELICFHENDTLKYHNNNYTGCFFSNIGTNQKQAKTNFKIFPNPTSGFITIETDETTELKEVLIKDVFGRTILTTDKLTVDLSNFCSGIYILNLVTDKGCYEKIVIRK